ncbi:hypothetical protein OU994_13000 [Pseudoduganella sp. SL102]|uniref:choice-of-anchor Q domain-containing protein n=1 Tax=Pseudoduganella sp. SL102 TaxID=2995154 RepID=UPI00248B02CC|nr:choice-of-anchor Q domain-containing protein [Pseudoduganella sp. SL102]WBS05123.1 hypothetical protein OU994_13000 [Pseudoduganella sp. SL102]
MKQSSVSLAISLLCGLAGACQPALAWQAGSSEPVNVELPGSESPSGEPYNVAVRSYPGPHQAYLAWSSDAADTTGFRIERRVAGEIDWQPVASIGAAARTHVDTDLRRETAFQYRIVGLGAEAAAGAASAQVELVTPGRSATKRDYDRAAAPRRLAAQPMNSQEIMLEWRDVTPDESGFRIERQEAGTDWREIAVVAADTQLYRDSGLQSGTAYRYRISALRDSGGVIRSEVAATTPPLDVQQVFYVDAQYGNNANPGTEDRPFASIQKAHDVMVPGQTVLVRQGTYANPWNYTVVMIRNSGTEGAPITYRNYPGERPLVKTTKGKNHHGIEVRDAAHIVIDGFEVEGHVKQVTYQEAKEQNDLARAYAAMTPPKYIGAIVDSNGISLTGKTLNKTHHIVIRNNVVRDTPGGGIAANFTDYVTIDSNRVSGTSAYSPYGTSGISFLTPYNFDGNTSGYKLVATGNVVSGASNLFPCNCFGFRQPTDGNGIIIDSFLKYAYAGRTLVANNIVFDNGGRGIHSLNVQHLDVFNNTTFQNSTIEITGEGEISMQKTRFARIWNNIMVARPDRPANRYFQSSDIDFSHNIVYGGNGWIETGGGNNRVGVDPRFAATAGPSAFQLAADSPAVDTAHAAGVPATDAYGAPRPRGAAADVGAVESF